MTVLSYGGLKPLRMRLPDGRIDALRGEQVLDAERNARERSKLA